MILGHESALGRLRSALRGGRAPHAWIFHGPFGVGKATVATEFARLALDPETTDAHIDDFRAPRGTEDAALIDAGTHPDLTIIRRELVAFSIDRDLRARTARNIPIDLLREHLLGGVVGGTTVDARIAQAPTRGRRRIFIIDEAELLEPVAQNALLKTLEEPPRGTWLILCTTRPDLLLPTIHSRCQGLRFGPLSEGHMSAWMDASLDGAPESDRAAERTWLLRFAEGSPGRAAFAERHGLRRWTGVIDDLLDRVARGGAPREVADALDGFIDELADALLKERRDALAALRPSGADEPEEPTDDDEAPVAAGGGAFKESKVNVKREAVGWIVATISHEVGRRLRTVAPDEPDLAERWAATLDLLAEAEAVVHANVQPKWALADFVARAAVLPAGAPR